jgi:4-hydroxy-2-oxoheptanedioate aldolase
MVNTREEAQRAVEYAKYPPLGTRSIGGVFGPYGFGTTNWLDYARMANDEIIVTVQVESSQALANLDDILSVPGIDVAFVGPNDLHAQLGLTPSTEGAEPEFVDALERIKAAAQKHHVTLGIFSGGGEAAAKRVRQGFQMVSVTTDISSMIADATQQLRLARGRR